MNKEKFLEYAHLYLMNELNESEQIEFENAMFENDDFKNEFDDIKVFYKTVSNNTPNLPDERALVEARNSLMRAIRNNEARPTLFQKIVSIVNNIVFTNYKFALSGAAVFVIGLFVGYLFFVSTAVNKNGLTNGNVIDIDKVQKGLESGEVKISNIRIPTSITGEAQIEVSFDAVKPISYKASAEDPLIRSLLASALITGKNPGLRLRTVNTISEQLESEKFNTDSQIKSALITSLKTDDNPAVRREALLALMKFNFDNDIRDAFLSVLSNDLNSGMRVLAINGLAQLKFQGNSLDDKILNVLNNKAENDESDFIRLRAASLVQEVN